MALSPSSFRKRYKSSYETPSSSASPTSSSTLPIRKRYRGTSEPILDTETEGDELEAKGTGSESEDSNDEGPISESEEAAPKGQQQQAVPVEDTSADEPLGLGYGAARCWALELAEDTTRNTFKVGQSSRSVPDQLVANPAPRLPVRPRWVDPKDGIVYLDIKFNPSSRAPVQTPASPEQSSGSLLISLASLTIPLPVPSPVTTPEATIAVDEDEFLEVGAQLELHGKLLDRSGVVRDEIHSQCFRLRSLEHGQERATITFGALWQPVLALEAWACQSDA
ncbi:hypothetical protein Tco_0079054 [Tanacetum coccineum]